MCPRRRRDDLTARLGQNALRAARANVDADQKLGHGAYRSPAAGQARNRPSAGWRAEEGGAPSDETGLGAAVRTARAPSDGVETDGQQQDDAGDHEPV